VQRVEVTGAKEVTQVTEATEATQPIRCVGHIAVFVNDTTASRAFYEDVLNLQWSQTDTPDMTALTRIINQSLCFMSCGDKQHHDLVLVEQFTGKGQTVPVQPDGLLHLTFALRPGQTLETIAARARARGQTVVEGSVFPALTGNRPAIYFRDPNGHVVEVLAPLA
jgi:catechol 2,3-dioxygenase-like lactoylglutathione lyase family enzyme